MKKLPTWVEVDLDHLIHNIVTIEERLRPGVGIMLVVKADAYGHGAVQVARAAAEHVRLFGVATLDEALELKVAGVRTDILILSPILESEIPMAVESGFAVTASSQEFARRLSDYAVGGGRTVDVHVEIDTGMGRTGVSVEEAETEIPAIAGMEGIALRGVYTHFPVSDTDSSYTNEQIIAFEKVVSTLRAGGVEIPVLHAANSAALASIDAAQLDLVRPGLLAYGHLPDGMDNSLELKPVLAWKSRVVRVREIPSGRTISYGRTFQTRRDTVMGVIPVGYGHGYPYALSGRGHMLVSGLRVPILGRVTMDMTMVDLTDLPRRPEHGDEVVLIGTQSGLQGDATITIHDLAKWAGSLGYEILCGLSKRVPRTYFRAGKVETYKSLLGVLPNHVAT